MVRTDAYVVIIPFREPTYELRRGGPPAEPYSASYEVRAASSREAIDLAIQRFEQKARDSGVTWVREIQREGIEVERSPT